MLQSAYSVGQVRTTVCGRMVIGCLWSMGFKLSRSRVCTCVRATDLIFTNGSVGEVNLLPVNHTLYQALTFIVAYL